MRQPQLCCSSGAATCREGTRCFSTSSGGLWVGPKGTNLVLGSLCPKPPSLLPISWQESRADSPTPGCTNSTLGAGGLANGPDVSPAFLDVALQYEPVITAGNEALVHHMEVFQCAAELDSIPPYNGPCDAKMKPEQLNYCRHVLAAWAMGAQVKDGIPPLLGNPPAMSQPFPVPSRRNGCLSHPCVGCSNPSLC